MALTSAPGLAPWSSSRPGRWSVWADRYNGETLGWMGVSGLTFSSLLSGFGTGEATVILDHSPLDRTDLLRLWSWRLWALYEGYPVWCGLPSSVKDDAGAVISLGFTELHGYLGRRAFDVVGGQRYDQVEQVLIAQDLAWPLTDLGVNILPEAGPGFLRDRSYEYLEGPYRSDLLSNLSQVISGPEFRMEYALGAQRPYANLRIAYPRVGSGLSQLGLTVPGNAVSPSLTWDAEKLRTRTFAVGEAERQEGAEEEPPKPVVVVDRPQPFMPRLDFIDDWPGVILEQTLRDRANSNALLYAEPALSITASVHETDPALLTYGLGDDVNVVVFDRLLEDGLSILGKLVGRSVNATAGTVAWTITVTSPPTQLRASNTQRVTRLASSMAVMFRRGAAPI